MLFKKPDLIKPFRPWGHQQSLKIHSSCKLQDTRYKFQVASFKEKPYTVNLNPYTDRRRAPGLKGSFFQRRTLNVQWFSRKIVLSFLIVALLTLPISGHGLEPSSTPSDPDTSSLLSLGIEGYQKLLSPVLDSNCYMQPSCSVYSKQALSEYGPVLGLLLTIDRLFHEANEDLTSPLVRQGKTVKLYDPPAANVWWKSK